MSMVNTQFLPTPQQINAKQQKGDSVATPQVQFGVNPFDIVEGGQEFAESNEQVQRFVRKGHHKRLLKYNIVVAIVAGPIGILFPYLVDKIGDLQNPPEKIELVETIEGDYGDPDTYTNGDQEIFEMIRKLDGRGQITARMLEDLIDRGWVQEVEAQSPTSEMGRVILIDEREFDTPLNPALRQKLEDENVNVVESPLTSGEALQDAGIRVLVALLLGNAIGVGAFWGYSKIRGLSYEEQIFAQQQALSKLARRIVGDELNVDPKTISLERIQKAFSDLEYNYDGENPITVKEWMDSWCVDLAASVMDEHQGRDITVANRGGVKSAVDKIMGSIFDMDMGQTPNANSSFMTVEEKKELAKKMLKEAEKMTRQIIDKYSIERLEEVAELMVLFEDHLADVDALAILKGEKSKEEVMALYPKKRLERVAKNMAKAEEAAMTEPEEIKRK